MTGKQSQTFALAALWRNPSTPELWARILSWWEQRREGNRVRRQFRLERRTLRRLGR